MRTEGRGRGGRYVLKRPARGAFYSLLGVSPKQEGPASDDWSIASRAYRSYRVTTSQPAGFYDRLVLLKVE